MKLELDEAFDLLFKAKTENEVVRVLDGLEYKIDWVPLGNHPGNFGVISMGADPYDGITERITNSIDAMIELEVELAGNLKQCDNPRKAVEQIYGFKDGSLKTCNRRHLGELASNIRVKFQDSGIVKRPTIEVWDKGIGQHPLDFPDTLVGLNQDYKVSKFYLIGAFGQGGQTSFDHCEYGIIISRKHPSLLSKDQKDEAGFTVVRYHDPTTSEIMFKKGRWEYCVDKSSRKVFSLPSSSIKVPFENGTLIRLVSYQMPRGTSDVLQPASTAWSFLSQSLFDPLLPIRLYETRTKYKTKSQSLTGLAYRLWQGGKGEKATLAISDSYDIELESYGRVSINYWAMNPVDEKEPWRNIKRGFVSGNNAVFITLNGQRHGVENTTFLRDKVNLAYSYDYLIVQIDCDGLKNRAKKELFSSTRDRLKEGEFKDYLLDHIVQHLKQDRNILAFENERKKKIMTVKSERDTSRIRKMVGQYIARNEELADLIKSKAREKTEGKVAIQEKEPLDDIREEELLIPELLPIPTYLKITNAKDPIPIEKGGNSLIRLETNAQDGYCEDDWDNCFRMIHEKGMTQRRSCSGLRNGKISYHIRCPSSVRVGTSEEIIFELDLPDGGQLAVIGRVICIPPYERKKQEKKIQLPEPKIYKISEEENAYQWAQFGWDHKSVGKVMMGSSEDAGIFVSLDNRHLKKILQMKKIKPENLKMVEDRYVAGIAYYLLLRKVHELNHKLDLSDDPNGSNDGCLELDRVAETISVLSIPPDLL